MLAAEVWGRPRMQRRGGGTTPPGSARLPRVASGQSRAHPLGLKFLSPCTKSWRGTYFQELRGGQENCPRWSKVLQGAPSHQKWGEAWV